MSHLEQAYEFDIHIRLYDDRAAPDGVVILAEDIEDRLQRSRTPGLELTASSVRSVCRENGLEECGNTVGYPGTR
jgi:hypothetical protein